MKHILLILVFATLLLVSPDSAGKADSLPIAGVAAVSGVPPVQVWRTGFAVKSLPGLSALTGQAASLVTTFRTNPAIPDNQNYFVFPASASQRVVNEASFYLLDRRGKFEGVVSLTLEIYDYNGVLQHVVSAGSVDLQSVAPQVWINLALTQPANGRLVNPGEFLAFHIASNDWAEQNLVLYAVFEVTVGPLPFQIFLPMTSKS